MAAVAGLGLAGCAPQTPGRLRPWPNTGNGGTTFADTIAWDGEYDVVVSGGYAEIDNDEVIILADHARRADDIDPDTVRETRDEAIEHLDQIDEGDHRRAYYEGKIRWCNLLLKQVTGSAAPTSH